MTTEDERGGVSGQRAGSGVGSAVLGKTRGKVVSPNARGALPARGSVTRCPKCGDHWFDGKPMIAYCEGAPLGFGGFYAFFCFRLSAHFHAHCFHCGYSWVEGPEVRVR